jgi:hypothetical protein
MIAASRPHRFVRRPATPVGGAVPPGTRPALPDFPRFRLGLVALALLAAPAAAQRVPPADPTPHQRAIAAGYKAAMVCSGLFSAGRTAAQVDADELAGIYPDYAAIVPTLTAQVNRRTASVSPCGGRSPGA